MKLYEVTVESGHAFLRNEDTLKESFYGVEAEPKQVVYVYELPKDGVLDLLAEIQFCDDLVVVSYGFEQREVLEKTLRGPSQEMQVPGMYQGLDVIVRLVANQ